MLLRAGPASPSLTPRVRMVMLWLEVYLGLRLALLNREVALLNVMSFT